MYWGILGFIITIGFLVTIHEYGHFFVARCFGVKIVRFSIGFGKPFLSWTGKKDGTKYTLAPIPLGGFVQMYGETDEEPVPESEKYRTFAAKAAWQRFLIAFAGPAVNLVFAVFAFSLLFMIGIKGITPEVAYIAPNSLASEAGLKTGDKLLSIDGVTIHLAQDAHIALAGSPHAETSIKYQRDGDIYQTQINFSHLVAGDEMNMEKVSGLYLVDSYWPAQVGEVIADSAAAKMGILKGDVITVVNGQKIAEGEGLFGVSEKISSAPNQEITLTVLRNGEKVALTGKLGAHEVKGKKYGFLGVKWAQVPTQSYLSKYQITEKYSVRDSLVKGLGKTIYYVKLTFNMFGRMLRHDVSFENMGGPLTIGDVAGKSLQLGWVVFLNFLGLVSLSLAAINFLPIPMLDGGHMLFSAIEMIRRKPLSEKTIKISLRAGQMVVFAFMALVIANDFVRYLV